jgi:hypothetical protein
VQDNDNRALLLPSTRLQLRGHVVAGQADRAELGSGRHLVLVEGELVECDGDVRTGHGAHAVGDNESPAPAVHSPRPVRTCAGSNQRTF